LKRCRWECEERAEVRANPVVYEMRDRNVKEI
jgi:hypothetical protein